MHPWLGQKSNENERKSKLTFSLDTCEAKLQTLSGCPPPPSSPAGPAGRDRTTTPGRSGQTLENPRLLEISTFHKQDLSRKCSAW